MLTESKVADRFWKEAIHIAIYIQNRFMLTPLESKTPNKLWFRKR